MQSPPIIRPSRPLAYIRLGLLSLLVPGMLAAQASSSEIQQIMDRLERLEQQNRSLAEEVHQLRQEAYQQADSLVGSQQLQALRSCQQERTGNGSGSAQR